MDELNDRELQEALQALMASERQRLSSAPDPEELLAYVEGTLAADDRERVERMLAVDPEAARIVADLTTFPNVRAVNPADEPDEVEIEREWQRFRQSRAAVVSAPTRAQEPRPRRRRFGRSEALAAVLGLAVLGLSARLLLPPEPAPQPNVPLLSLLPVGASSLRGPEGDERLPAEAAEGGLFLQLNFAGPTEGESFRVAIADAEERPVWTSEEFVRQPDDTFTAQVPAGFLTPGRYRVELSARRGGSWQPLATYVFALDP